MAPRQPNHSGPHGNSMGMGSTRAYGRPVGGTRQGGSGIGPPPEEANLVCLGNTSAYLAMAVFVVIVVVAITLGVLLGTGKIKSGGKEW
ncbi:hypothetical protein LOZ12_001431 [Ophidiomyces ophidiicola]|uniref:Uncharacterized protein n=1 Tax=Ophidiomyces ophidiicola TaxID=1387563 RepID=A0ACB8UU62_9EURO|nr:hypothetical protein LOZ64_004196 [Ophidiomyces ophidiicola]KAI1913703.1 hypothetical protein LOZ61_002589 [Ophidiomyces ophidiicola]KAI1928671.1 hypothetical protein LOZ60_002220 [Ophidiomyces ophidiicola]KAI1938646.1 hypothetical protein LOZ66_003449 [Ophidiomyces ophidiicola]KAI1944551.1 hypothetical protein LOZ62_004138 [Ophidiomyces ophidiicola]